MCAWLAGPAFKGNPGDTRVEGDPVPEAAKWKHLRIWEKARHIRWVPDAPAIEAARSELDAIADIMNAHTSTVPSGPIAPPAAQLELIPELSAVIQEQYAAIVSRPGDEPGEKPTPESYVAQLDGAAAETVVDAEAIESIVAEIPPPDPDQEVCYRSRFSPPNPEPEPLKAAPPPAPEPEPKPQPQPQPAKRGPGKPPGSMKAKAKAKPKVKAQVKARAKPKAKPRKGR